MTWQRKKGNQLFSVNEIESECHVIVPSVHKGDVCNSQAISNFGMEKVGVLENQSQLFL